MSYQAKIGLGLDTTQFEQGGRRAGQSLDRVKTSGVTAMRTIDSSTTQATTKINQMKQATDRATMSFQANGMAMLAVGTSLAGLYTSISNLNKATIGVARAEMGLKRARDLQGMTVLAIERIEFKLKKMREEGKEATEQFAMAQNKLAMQRQKLTTATEDLAVKEADLLQKQDDLQDTQILFGVMVINTMVSAVVMGKQAVQGLTKAMVIEKAVALKSTVIKGLQSKATAVFGITAGATAKKLGLMTVATKLLNLSMGKILLIATGVILAFEGIAQVIKHFNPEIDITIGKLSGDLFNSMTQTMDTTVATGEAFAETGEQAVAMGNNVETSSGQMAMYDASIQQLNASMTGIQNGFNGTQQSILNFNKALEGNAVATLTAQADMLTNQLQLAIDNGLDPMSAEFKLAFKDMLPAITAVADNMEVAFGADTAHKFVQNFKDMSKGAIAEIDAIADKYAQLKKKQRDIDQLADSMKHKIKDRGSEWQQKSAGERITSAESMFRSMWEIEQRNNRIMKAGGFQHYDLGISKFSKQLGLPEYQSSLNAIQGEANRAIKELMNVQGRGSRQMESWALNIRMERDRKSREVIAQANAERARLRNLANQAGAGETLWRDIIVDKNSRRQLNDMIAWKQSMGIATTGVV